jgi:hypothetical protein
MPVFALQNGHQADLDHLLRERIAVGLAGDESSKGLAAIVEEELLSSNSDDGRPAQV